MSLFSTPKIHPIISKVKKKYLSLEAKMLIHMGSLGRSWEWSDNSITKLTFRTGKRANYPITQKICFSSCRSANYEKSFGGMSILQGFLSNA